MMSFQEEQPPHKEKVIRANRFNYMPMTKSCWVLSESHAGMRNQAIGLAEALGLPYDIKTVRSNVPWGWLPATLWPLPLQLNADGGTFAPPWPDVLISCGRRSVASALAIKRASGGKTFAIHIQQPQVNPKLFDLVIVPEHDRLRGPNVITMQGAIHRITPEKLAAAAAVPEPRFAHLPRPLVAVLVGGPTKRQKDFAPVITDLTTKLKQAVAQDGVGLAVTISRRTGAANEQILRDGLAGLPAYIWDGQGDNPYLNMLAQADAIIVTGDSISMVSEACSTGKPVYIHEVDRGSRFTPFFDYLYQNNMARVFEGRIESWEYHSLKTEHVVNLIKAKLF